MLSSVKRTMWLVVAVIAVIAIVAGASYWGRCHGAPLKRDEAVRRASDRVERFTKSYNVGRLPLAVREVVYEEDSKSWRVTFGNDRCVVAVIVDRCHGDDIGGSTGCPSR
jgi:hypothetical protein